MRNQAVLTPGLRRLLALVLLLFALLLLDSVYLATVTFLEWVWDTELQGPVFQAAFLLHLLLGVLVTVPALAYAALHLRRAITRPNRLAVRLGLALFGTILALLGSGFLLTRGLPGFELRHPEVRSVTYWIHVIAPVAAAWLFVLHRLAGPPLRWRAGAVTALLGLAISATLLVSARPDVAEGVPRDFLPSLARTATGGTIDSRHLMQDDYCAECHGDIHRQWQVSAHRFASFNNPAYRFSVRNTRQMSMARDGHPEAARFCAGCHDPVPLFSGAFDDPDFDDERDPTAHAGITCNACHAIQAIGSPRGNADYVIDAPRHYPFTHSDNVFLQWVNGLLIKGKPALHQREFLKPLHRSPEFCGTCHKVHLPASLNDYRWLRGQNHYDSFLLSGVSGHGVASFYYPEQAAEGCSDCHMPKTASTDFGARPLGVSGELVVGDHRFPGANTALSHLLPDIPGSASEAHRNMLEGALRLDVFGIYDGDDVDAPLMAPLGQGPAELRAGRTYLAAIVVRNLRVGHLFTEGTSDSNQAWLDVTLTSGTRTIGRSGGTAPPHNQVDPWAHFVNAYVIDRNGNRIDRRNAEDIFTKVYDHQIPPGASDVVFYRFEVPDQNETLELTASLRYRKFDTKYLRLFLDSPDAPNDLPVVTIARASAELVSSGSPAADQTIPEWERWNDFGIALLLKPGKRSLRQAESAFERVEALGRPEGPLGLARVFLAEGRVDEAREALDRAHARGALPWSVAWFGAQTDLQSGNHASAIRRLQQLERTDFPDAARRGFDFAGDYRLQNQLGQAWFEYARIGRGTPAEAERLEQATRYFEKTLSLDPENVAAHYGLSQVLVRTGDHRRAQTHREAHERYRPDDNARDRAIALARARDPAADHAAEALAVYDLHRPGAPGRE